MMTDTQRLTNYHIARANDELRTQLAKADQQIEWLSNENAALKRYAEEVTELLELRSVTGEALDTIRKRAAHDAAEIEKWKGLSSDLGIDLLEARYAERALRDRVAFLEKALNSKPGTVYYGSDGFYIRGQDEDSKK